MGFVQARVPTFGICKGTYATLATGSVGDVDESALVGIALLGTTSELLLLLLLGNLGGLRLDLTGTSQRTVDFTLREEQTRKRGKKALMLELEE